MWDLLGTFFGKIRSKVRPRNYTLQEFHFRNSLSEIGIEKGNIKTDHLKGCSWHKETGWVPIVFPESYINEANSFAVKKENKYFFKGVIGPNRSWIRNYSGVQESYRGRNVDIKFIFDEDYFRGLGVAEFGLSPTGDCPWSYRFFESIMCMAIPLLGDGELDIFAERYQVARDGDAHSYDVDAAESNFSMLLSNHTLRGILGSPRSKFDCA